MIKRKSSVATHLFSTEITTMRFLVSFALIVAVSLTVTATADEGQVIAQDLTELRQQLGLQFQASEHGFQQAVQNVAKGEQPRDASSYDDWGTPVRGQLPNNFSPRSPYTDRPHRHRRPQPTPATRLRETAFQLDRLAHELEMAELYGGADTLRKAAGKLRLSARHTLPRPSARGTVDGGPHDKHR